MFFVQLCDVKGAKTEGAVTKAVAVNGSYTFPTSRQASYDNPEWTKGPSGVNAFYQSNGYHSGPEKLSDIDKYLIQNGAYDKVRVQVDPSKNVDETGNNTGDLKWHTTYYWGTGYGSAHYFYAKINIPFLGLHFEKGYDMDKIEAAFRENIDDKDSMNKDYEDIFYRKRH